MTFYGYRYAKYFGRSEGASAKQKEEQSVEKKSINFFKTSNLAIEINEMWCPYCEGVFYELDDHTLMIVHCATRNSTRNRAGIIGIPILTLLSLTIRQEFPA